MKFEVDGIASYAYTGARPLVAGRPAVVFVHGGGLDHSVWIHQSRYFAHHGFNAVALDLPGHGRSGGEPLDTITGMADWTMRAADALGLGLLRVAGHSMGSLVALEAAGRYPERVDAAALVGCAVPMAVTSALLEAAKANDHAAFDMITLWGHRMGAQLGGNPAPGMWMTGGGVRLLERSRPGVLHNDLDACNAYRHGLETAAKITCPVHLLIGREDAMAPPRATRALIAALAMVRVVELADCGHMLMAEQPDAVRDALIAAFSAPVPDPSPAMPAGGPTTCLRQ